MTIDLFPDAGAGGGRRPPPPLADRMRPRTLSEVVGQEHLLGEDRPFRRALESGQIGSLVLWGPPGSGKTTIARLVAAATSRRFVAFSAVTSGVADIRRVIADARREAAQHGRATILFVDEFHRFNKSQQDAFLPHVESGLLTLVGATTENPSFEINSALLSRLQVLVLHPLDHEHLVSIVRAALADGERGLGGLGLEVEPEAAEAIASLAGGDARVALNLLEAAARIARGSPPRLDRRLIEAVAGRPAIRHDRAGDQHYDLVSAFIKSIRGSDADAGMYWLARMLEGGEDPLFIARRLVILASEDIGNAEPQALPMAVAAYQAAHQIGMPEARLVLAQVTAFLATAPKSNSALEAIVRAREDARRTPAVAVPLHLRNAPTRLLQELGHGRGYRYPHSEDDAEQAYLPPELAGRRYYEPHAAGFEVEIGRRMAGRRRVRAAGAKGGRPSRKGARKDRPES